MGSEVAPATSPDWLPSQCHLCQPEIQNLGVSAFGHENVCRLDVAVDDAFRMGCVQRISDLDRQGQQDVQLQGPSCDAVLQGHAIQVLHGDERLTVLLANVIDRADVGMVESGRRTASRRKRSSA